MMNKIIQLGLLLVGLSVLVGCDAISNASCWWQGQAFKEVQDDYGKIYSLSKYEPSQLEKELDKVGEALWGESTLEVNCQLIVEPDEEQVESFVVRGLGAEGEGYIGYFLAERLSRPGHKPEPIPYKLIELDGGLVPGAPTWE